VRRFIAQDRCIYSELKLDDANPELRQSLEHIVPLSLGGSNGLTINDVSVGANNKAGNEVDDPVASSLPFLIMRHRYGLAGNRGTVPNIKFKGEFQGSQLGSARLEIDTAGQLSFALDQDKRINGSVVEILSSEPQVRKILSGYLKSARANGKVLTTPFGRITDEEDIEVAIAVANRVSGENFRVPVQIDLEAFHRNLVRFMIKISLGLGHRVLGREWSYGAPGMFLRQGLFPKKGASLPSIRGTTSADFDDRTKEILGIRPDRHILTVMPCGKKTTAIIALFGGELGIGVVNLGYDARRLIRRNPNLTAVFEIPLTGADARRTKVMSLATLGEINALAGII
jgi:hypothetical protein